MIILPDEDIVYPGVTRLDPWTFERGAVVPVFEAQTVHALNYVVGYAKHINRDECSVYSRGQGQLYNNLRPSLYRKFSNLNDEKTEKAYLNANAKLNDLVNSILSNRTLLDGLGFPRNPPPAPELIEAMLQHYGVRTRMLDAVDNHWIAIWFGLYEQLSDPVGGKPYALYQKREIRAIDIAEGHVKSGESLYQYILLVASAESNTEPARTLDLRLSLPQKFVRPHAQHGVMLDYQGDITQNSLLDYSDSVVGIVRIRIDRAAQWIGSGHLISYANLFPPEAFDNGYSILLKMSEDLRKRYDEAITNYVYDVG